MVSPTAGGFFKKERRNMKLLWLDLETTGLDPIKDSILEVAAMTADLEAPFETGSPYETVLNFNLQGISVHPAVIEMHTKNGLWKACAQSATFLGEVEEQLLSMIPQSTDRENQTTLAGSSISFDLSFIRQKMPKLARLLHYRVYDVSSVVLFCRSLGMSKLPKAEAHRAMADVRESVQLAKHCADWVGWSR